MNMRIIHLILFCFITVSVNAQKLLTIDEAIAIALKNSYDIMLVKNDAQGYAIDYQYVNAAFLPG